MSAGIRPQLESHRLEAKLTRAISAAAKDSDFAAALSHFFSDGQPAQEERVAISDHRPDRTTDPFVARQGQDGFRSWIDSQSIEQLKSIVSEHLLDVTGNARKWKTREKLVELIIERVESRAKQRGVFRRYGEPKTTDGVVDATTVEPKDQASPDSEQGVTE